MKRLLFLLPALVGVAALAPVSAAPVQTDADVIQRIAFGSCARESKPQPIWDTILALRPQIYIGLGDNIYGDTEDMELLREKYAKLAAQPGFKRLRQSCRVLMTWDDHDYGVNDGGMEYPKRKESQQVFLDFLGEPTDSPRRQQEGIYAAYLYGPPAQRVQVILLDTRYHRTALKKSAERRPGVGPYEPNPDPAGTMLGATQWQWLEEQLQVPARLRIIGSSIQFVAEDHGWEKWANLPLERQRMLDLIKKTKAEGIVFLSGDRHLAEISMMNGGLSFPVYDVTSSGLTEAARVFRPLEPNRHRVATMNWDMNFGFITINWLAQPPVVSLQIRDDDGDIRIQQKLSLRLLNPSEEEVPTAAAAPAPSTKAEAESSASVVTEVALTQDKPITPDEAGKKVGQNVTVQFVVRATGSSGTRVFLNSESDRNDPRNFTIVIEKAGADALAKDGIDDPRSYYRGKTVRVTGKVETFRDAPQIKVTRAQQITVAGGDDDRAGPPPTDYPPPGGPPPRRRVPPPPALPGLLALLGRHLLPAPPQLLTPLRRQRLESPVGPPQLLALLGRQVPERLPALPHPCP
ncbi:MAG TPA: alkaline phosphatase D family protein, partial [Gemmatales bacterium]|nr:alkaline phosphatase D family protein [Gemmatales bacterium]